MSDLAQRLRLNATIPMVMEAADRIEALEAALRQIAALEDLPSSLSVAKSIARTALAPETEK